MPDKNPHNNEVYEFGTYRTFNQVHPRKPLRDWEVGDRVLIESEDEPGKVWVVEAVGVDPDTGRPLGDFVRLHREVIVTTLDEKPEIRTVTTAVRSGALVKA